MGLNFVGNTWSSNFMSAGILREALNQTPGALEKILGHYADDMSMLARTGLVSKTGEKVFFLHVATKGDLPALCKVGGFKRTHSHVPRQPSSKRACLGICHMCLGGQEASADDQGPHQSFPFEDTSLRPSWGPTVNQVPPWDAEPVILRGLPMVVAEKPSFFVTDIWHNLHLGLAKHFFASSIVSIIEKQVDPVPCNSVDAAFQFFSEDFVSFCKGRKMTPFMDEISRETMSFPYAKACPVGRWSKGLVATQFLLYLADFCGRHVTGHSDDELLLAIAPKSL